MVVVVVVAMIDNDDGNDDDDDDDDDNDDDDDDDGEGGAMTPKSMKSSPYLSMIISFVIWPAASDMSSRTWSMSTACGRFFVALRKREIREKTSLRTGTQGSSPDTVAGFHGPPARSWKMRRRCLRPI